MQKATKKIKTVIKESEDKKSFKVPAICWDWKKCGSGTTKVQDIEEFNDELDDTFSITDIPAFCRARFFMVVKAKDMGDASGNEDMIVFLKPYYFHPRKYIMMSATVDKDICEYCFGRDNVEFCECRQARNTGELIQYYDRSMSRYYIDEHPDVISKIRSKTGFKNVITFKKYKCGDMYFGNAIGCDRMKEQDIAVIGTPYKVDFVYKLLPLTLGLDIDVEEEVKMQIVSHNGYHFSFTTYEDEVLQKFHMWMIESKLEQAVGRARLTRCDCTVKLYSNFPMKQAEMRKLDFDI